MAYLHHPIRAAGLKSGFGCDPVLCLGTTEAIQRVGVLDRSSSTERTIPVMGSPSMVNIVFSPRYWAKQQRRASFGSIVSNFFMLIASGRGNETNKKLLGKEGETLSMPDKEVQINFHAPATLRKWPSVNGERISASLGARPYLIIDGTLDECIRRFMSQPKSQHHLYEIHTAPQSDLVSAILSAEHIVELARLRDFL